MNNTLGFISTVGEFIMANLAWLIPAAVGVLVLIIVIIVVPIVVHNKKKKKAQETATQNNANVSAKPAQSTAATDREIIYRAELVYDEPEDEAKEETPVSEEKEQKTSEPEKAEVKEPAVKEKKPAEKKLVTIVSKKSDGKSSAQKALEKARETKALSAKAAASSLAVKEESQQEEAKPGAKIINRTPEKPAKKENQKRVGKWTIELKADGEYVAKLSATNGEVMLTSEVYSDKDGAIKGIATIIKNIESGKFIIYRDKSNNYYYKLKSTGNRLLCVGEIYQTKDQCERAVQSVQRIAADATVFKDVVEGKYIDYTPIPTGDIELPKTPGKWKVEKGDNGYQAKLFAANSQLMLSTEEVSTKKGATDAIETVKEYALQGNFRIDRDKSKRFYWKLRNNQKSVICIGEAYESLDSCFKSLETVRRYVATAELEN